MNIEPIAHIHTNLSGKFGLPRQAGVIPELTGVITFEPDYRCADALRGLEDFSHVWLLWGFSESAKEKHHGFYGDAPYAPMVRPPRLGGNERKGVFATRSPFRPNNLGMSVVKLERITEDLELVVSGVDLMDGTPIYDIKPYMPYSDSLPEASEGFTCASPDLKLTLVNAGDLHEFALAAGLDEEMEAELTGILRNDPRPQYQRDPDRVYGLTYGGHNVRFRISDTDALTVLSSE
ncbi:MAG: tRNA (N6-threonylcarbamoyladenosine(37)-N6)-methyltransferase TrmO [Bacteroidales bacterium]|nr:tRNA (N6-threonylcarbamoyladenosine(37)-N6)-methyltransferase TrmO [Bacteroidales bacterium]